MDKINFFPDNFNIKNQKVILRLDLNVPLKDRIIMDDTRIKLCLPFIKSLINKKAKIIIISHLGRPKGAKDPALSLAPIYKYLKKKLHTNVYFFMGNFDDEIKEKFSHLKEGEVILIENIRYFIEETDDDENFSKKLASLGDVYINDAFSCSHRKQSSVHKITKFINKSFAGPLMKKEIDAINLVIKNNKNEVIKQIFDKANKNNCNLIIPEDCVVGTSFDGEGINKTFEQIEEDEIILDIGSNTISNIKQIIGKSKTVLWNGPAGYFENKNFLRGTISIAETISKKTNEKTLISVLGGGDTLSAVNKSKNKLSFSHLSTAGGAFLEYLEGKDLPGLSVLK